MLRHALRLVVVASVIASTAGLSQAPQAGSDSTFDLLERYLAGDGDDVAAMFDGQTDYERILTDLRRGGERWIAAGSPEDLPRRELAAATFALEAARVGAWVEWKLIVRQSDGPLPVIYWQSPPLLIEWACALLRRHPAPTPVERLWQLAALTVAQHSEDGQFQIGDTRVDIVAAPASAGPSRAGVTLSGLRLQPRAAGARHPDEVLNTQDEIKHLMHVMDRFPAEMRFRLAQGVARERLTPTEAEAVYRSLADDDAVGGEARMRLGMLYLRQRRGAEALTQFDRVEWLTRDRDVIYLARLGRAQWHVRQKRETEAIAALQAALAARPGSQSASAMLAPLLVARDRVADAQAMMAAIVDPGREPFDPWIDYVHADDRFWPRLIARLREEIRR